MPFVSITQYKILCPFTHRPLKLFTLWDFSTKTVHELLVSLLSAVKISTLNKYLDFISPTLGLAVTFHYFILSPGKTPNFPHLLTSVSYIHSSLDFRRVRFQDPQRRAKNTLRADRPKNNALASPSLQKHCDVNSMNMYRSKISSSSRTILMFLSIKRAQCCISVLGQTPAK
jgi:hypothetical protein